MPPWEGMEPSWSLLSPPPPTGSSSARQPWASTRPITLLALGTRQPPAYEASRSWSHSRAHGMGEGQQMAEVPF